MGGALKSQFAGNPAENPCSSASFKGSKGLLYSQLFMERVQLFGVIPIVRCPSGEDEKGRREGSRYLLLDAKTVLCPARYTPLTFTVPGLFFFTFSFVFFRLCW